MANWFSKSKPAEARAAREQADIEGRLQRASECEQRGEQGAAQEHYRQILELQPDHPAAGRLLARILALQALAHQESGVFDAAIEMYEESLALDGAQAQVRNNLGNVYNSLGRIDDAILAYRDAVGIEPGLAEARFNLGSALYRLGDRGQAISHCRAALALRPSFPEASATLGYLLEEEGDTPGAIECYREAIAARPDYAEAHFNYALQLLLSGDYANGWQEYEWRLQLPEVQRLMPFAGRKHWDGSALDGATILLYAEQGLGDAIQFVRYAPLVAERGGRVVVRCVPGLAALIGSMPGVSAVVSVVEPTEFDVCCPLMSLPRIFGTTLETVPAQVPYMRPDSEKARRWKARLDADGASFKVGLYWATETSNRIASLKSLTLEMLAPLAGVRGVAYYSLQRGLAAAQAAHPPAGMKLVNLAEELGNFSDDAALVANLDLVISIDTATAHLVGALGRRVWTLTHFPPEWRWLLGRDDSPWYPTMRLFRRGKTESWESVTGRVAEALGRLVNGR